MPEQFSPHIKEQAFSGMQRDLYEDPLESAPAEAKIQPLDKHDANQEPLDAEIISEEKFGPSTAVELHSGVVREPGIYEATIMTEEATAALEEARAKEDAILAEQHRAKEEAVRAAHRRGAASRTMGAYASHGTKDTFAGSWQTAERTPSVTQAEYEQLEEFNLTLNTLHTTLNLLPDSNGSKLTFQEILQGKGNNSDLLNLNKIRRLLTKKYQQAIQKGESFTPEMAMAHYQKLFDENYYKNGDDYKAELVDRYHLVRDIFNANPDALKPFMGMTTEEIHRAA